MGFRNDEFNGHQLGKYQLLCRIAIGGMAEIFLGCAQSGPFAGRPVVIKRILREQREDANAMQMLIDEARLTAHLHHPNVAQVLDLEAVEGDVLLVIEFIEGATLEELADVVGRSGEALPLAFTLTVIRDAALALSRAHEHRTDGGVLLPIIHRDVTPRNIMIDFSGRTKVLDFGIARAKGSERRTQAGMVRGTTAYMSPEQAIAKELDPRTDVFSLGIIFHELLTGQRLFYRGNPGQEMAAVYEGPIALPSTVDGRATKEVDAVVMKMLERDLSLRYQSSADVARDLDALLLKHTWKQSEGARFIKMWFAKREAEIAALVAQIPATTDMQLGLPPSASLLGDEDPMRTLVAAKAIGSQRTPSLTDVFATVPGVPNTFNDGATSIPPMLRPVDGHAHSSSDSTRLISAPRAPKRVWENKTTVIEQTAPRRSRGMHTWVLAGVLLLAAGFAGAAFQGYWAERAQARNTLVRVRLVTDRSANVWMGGLHLGVTPISLVVPAGGHAFELSEGEKAPRHPLQVEIEPTVGEKRIEIKLDELL